MKNNYLNLIKGKAMLLLLSLFSMSTLFSQTYFWVGGAGDWHDYANHWATTSGGNTFHVQAPQSFNDVVFDAQSGFNPNDKVTHTNIASAVCNSMTWQTGVIGVGLTSANNKVLDVYGSFLLEVDQDMDGYRGKIRFLSSGNETITWSGNFTKFRGIYFEPLNGNFVVTDYLRQEYGTTNYGGIFINTLNGSVTFNDTVKCEGNYEGIHMYSGTATFNALVWGYTNLNYSPEFGHSTLWGYHANGGVTNFNAETYIYFLNLNAGTINATNGTHYWTRVADAYSTFNGALNISNSLIECESSWGVHTTAESLTTTNSTINIYKSFSPAHHLYNNVIAKKKMVYKPKGAIIDTLICEKGISYFDGVAGKDSIVSLLRWMPGNYGLPVSKYNPRMYIKNTCNVEILGDCENWVVNNGIDFIFEGFTTGSLTSDFMRLENSQAFGPGIPYIAGPSSYIVSNSPDWITGTPAPRTLIWQGPIVAANDYVNFGDWHDMNNWGLDGTGAAPGNPIGANCPPTIQDSVIFPNDSYVRIREPHANCKGMNWLGTGTFYDSIPTNNYRLLEIYGSLVLSADMSNEFYGNIAFRAWETYPTITSNGQQFNFKVNFNGLLNTAEWHILDSMSVPNSYYNNYVFNLQKGHFHTNGFPLTVDNFLSTELNGQSMNLYNSDVWVLGDPARYNAHMWRNTSIPNMYMNSGTSHIHFTKTVTGGNERVLYGNNQTFYDITYSCFNPQILRSGGGIAKFHHVTFEQGGQWTDYYTGLGGLDSIVKLETNTLNDSTIEFNLDTKGTFDIDSAFYHGNTNLKTEASYNYIMKLFPGKAYDLTKKTSVPSSLQTLTNANVLDANGTCVNNIVIKNGAFFSTGNQAGDYLQLTDNTASNATFTYTNSSLSGTTTGWSGVPNTPRTLYWIDQTAGVSTGQWNDMLHWTQTDGVFDGGNCPPTIVDTVIFNDNSFTGNDTVQINLNTLKATCADMRWLNTAAVSPVFYSDPDEGLIIHASLEFSPTMDQLYQGHVIFNTDSMNQTILTNGKSFKHFVFFDGNGEWTLLDDFTQWGGDNNNPYGAANSKFQFTKGTLNTNDKTLSIQSFLITGDDPKTFNIDQSEIIVTRGYLVQNQWNTYFNFYVKGTNLTLDADSSHVRFIHNYYAAYNGFRDITNQGNVWNDITYRTLTNGLVGGTLDASTCYFGKVEFSELAEVGITATNHMHIENLVCTNPISVANIRADSTVFDTVNFAGPAFFYQDNYYNDVMNFTDSKTYTFGTNKTQHLDNSCTLNAIATAGNEIQFYSSLVGQPAYIRKDSGYVCVNYIYLRDLHAIGDGVVQSGACSLSLPQFCDTILTDSYLPTQATSGRAVFSGGANANDQGNNKGWDFTPFPPPPAVNLVTADITICDVDSVLLAFEIVGDLPFNASYYDSIPGNPSSLIDSIGVSNVVSGTGTPLDPYIWEFYVHPTVSGEIYSAGDVHLDRCFNAFAAGVGTTEVTLTPSPSASNAGADQIICADNTTFTATAPAIGTGTWALVSGTGNITDNTDPVSTVTGLTVGDNIFEWVISNGSCAVTRDTVIITFDTDNDLDGICDSFDSDDDNDGISDSEEGTGDSDGDGIPDVFDLDSDNDGIPDIVEAGGADTDGDGMVDGFTDADGDGQDDNNILTNVDTDNDGIPNSQDLDADNDGTPDVTENNGTDADGDGVLDGFVDVDGDGFNDLVDSDNNNNPGPSDGGTPLTIAQTDGDNVPDYLDLDSDNDGIPDVIENGGTDADGDGTLDGFVDVDNDGFNDLVDTDNNLTPAVNDGTGTNLPNGDFDNDGIPNAQDLDSDNDGIVDVVEAGGTDADGDGILDGFVDADNDGFNDLVDTDDNTTPAVLDGNGTSLPNPDTDGIGGADYLDIDADGDGIVDNIEGQSTSGYLPPLGMDSDGDGIDDQYDVDNNGNIINPIDTDFDNAPDYQDTDSDNDGEDDLLEGWDTDGDGVADTTPSGLDSDNDGLDDAFDTTGLDNTTGPDGTNSSNGGTLPTDFPDTDYPGLIDQDWREDASDNDGDGIPNVLDIDNDNDGIPDLVEDVDADGDGNPLTNPTDTDGDGIPDIYDLDSDNDGIPDIVEAGGDDTNNDGLVDDINVDGTLINDTDGDGLDDNYDGDNGGTNILNPDTDGDGHNDFQDVDSDNDGIMDIVEDGGTDADGDGLVDSLNADGTLADDANGDGWSDGNGSDGQEDTDGDGISDYIDLDSDNDGTPDIIEDGGVDTDGDGMVDNFTDADGDGADDNNMTDGLADTDGDGIPNHEDLDSDNDGITDAIENGKPDVDGDGMIDGFTDADGNGWDDNNPTTNPTDTDGDGISDDHEIDSDDDGIDDIIEGGGTDTNGDGVIDNFNDANGDGLDDDDNLTPPDTDGDGNFDFQDLDSDDDGVSDSDENDPNGDGVGPDDTDGDGTPDYQDIDDDGDDILTKDELDADEDGVLDDCDEDGTPDYLDPDKCVDGLDIPQGFSPDKDGYNDYFVIKGTEAYPNLTITIFNRWGNKVYESTGGYPNDWDGTNQFGMTVGTRTLPEGTYFYVIDLGEGNGKDDIIKGYVYLKK